MHVEDCADIIAKVVRKSKLMGIYNIKGEETYSVKELVKQFENQFGVMFKKSFSQDQPWENIVNLDDSKLKISIDLQPKWKFFYFIKKEMESKIHA